MGLPRGVELMSDDVHALLIPGEQALAFELATQLAGHTGIGGDPAPRPGLHFDTDPIGGGVAVDQCWVDSVVGGVNAAGARGSIADGFSAGLDVASAKILVTDRRLLVVGDEGTLRTTPVRIRFGVDRRAVVRAERTPRPLQRGRVRLEFADGSWAMAMLGTVKASAAGRVLTALGAA